MNSLTELSNPPPVLTESERIEEELVILQMGNLKVMPKMNTTKEILVRTKTVTNYQQHNATVTNFQIILNGSNFSISNNKRFHIIATTN